MANAAASSFSSGGSASFTFPGVISMGASGGHSETTNTDDGDATQKKNASAFEKARTSVTSTFVGKTAIIDATGQLQVRALPRAISSVVRPPHPLPFGLFHLAQLAAARRCSGGSAATSARSPSLWSLPWLPCLIY